MSQIVLGQDAAVWGWASRLMPIPISGLKDCATIGIAENGNLWAAAIFSDYRRLPHGRDIQVHFASENPLWATRGNIRAILSYPFCQLGCTRLTTVISRKNKRARKLIEGLGFHLEGVHRRAYDGKYDAFSFSMLRDEAERWLKTGVP